jgi:2-O-A-mannosyl-D-glycerate-specific PTS system IIC component
MNLTTLTHTSAVCVQAHYASRDEAIRQLTMRLVALGKITDGDAFWRRSTVANRRGQPPWVKGWLSRMVNRTR